MSVRAQGDARPTSSSLIFFGVVIPILIAIAVTIFDTVMA